MRRQPRAASAHPALFIPLLAPTAISASRRTVIRLSLVAMALLAASGGLFRWRVLTNAPLIIERAEALLEAQRASDSRAELRWLLWFHPRHSAARLLEGLAFRQAGDLKSALRSFSGVGAEAPEATVAQLQTALILIQESRLQEAEALLRRVVQRTDDPEALHELQWLLFNQFRLRELEALLENQVQRHPERHELLRHLLLSELKNPVPQEGLGYLLAVDKQQPGQPMVQRALGFCHWRMGAIDAARNHFEQAMASVDENQQPAEATEIRTTVAEFLIEQGAVAAAAKICPAPVSQVGLPLEIDDRVWAIQARIEEARGHFPVALDLLQKAVQKRPFELRYTQMKGALLRRLGRAKQADETFRQAQEFEGSQMKLTELALGQDLEHPSPDLCRQLSDLLRQRGRALQSRGWAQLAESLVSPRRAP